MAIHLAELGASQLSGLMPGVALRLPLDSSEARRRLVRVVRFSRSVARSFLRFRSGVSW